MNLFDSVVDDEQQHPSFRQIAVGPARLGARRLMQRTFDQWECADPQFVREFQTVGFDARVWELYLAATLANLGWSVGGEAGRPDFRCRGRGIEFFVEAATANLSGNPEPPASSEEYREQLRSATRNRDEVAVRFGSVLRSKVNKRYQELPHVEGKPLVIALQGFFGPRALLHNELPLVRYLYDMALTEIDNAGAVSLTSEAVGRHIGDSKTIASGWFGQAEASSVSAVVWSNSGTVAKFNRMAVASDLAAPGWEIHRYGTELDATPGATERAVFVERVEPDGEPWEEGLVVMHNPHARIPLPSSAAAGMTQLRQTGDALSIEFVGRKIFSQRSTPHRIADREKVLSLIHDQLSPADDSD